MKTTKRALTALAIVVGSSSLGCSSEEPGQLVIVVQSDMHLPKDIDTVRIEIFNEGVPKFKNDYERLGLPDGPFLLPGTLTLVGSEDPSDVARIVVSAFSGGTTGSVRIVREAVTTVPTERTATLQLPMQFLCDGSGTLANDGNVMDNCPEGQTCLAGRCEDEVIDSAGLPDYKADDIFVAGVCIDVSVCFNAGEALDVDPNDCTVPAVTESNIAIETEGDGICGGVGCFVALDAESSLGWQTLESGRIQLPTAICDSMGEGVVTPGGVVKRVVAAPVNASCPFKTVSVPTCGPWSAAGVGAVGEGPVVLAGSQANPSSLLITDEAIHGTVGGSFTADGSVKRVGFAGGTPTTTAEDQPPPRSIDVREDGSLVWTVAPQETPDAGAIMTLEDGMPVELIGGLTLPEGIRVDENRVFWTEFTPTGGIWRANATSGSGAVLLATGNYPYRVEVDGARVYWTNEGTLGLGDGSVAYYDDDAAEVVVVADNQETPRGLALDRDSGTLYWTTFADGGALMRADVSGASVGEVVALASDQSFPNGVTVDEGHVYWTTRGEGRVLRLPKTSSPSDMPEVVASVQRSPAAIAVDADSVYWLNEGIAAMGTGSITRVDKP